MHIAHDAPTIMAQDSKARRERDSGKEGKSQKGHMVESVHSTREWEREGDRDIERE